MKRWFSVIIMTMITFFYSGCRADNYEFIYDRSEVLSVQIVEVSDVDSVLSMTICVEVEDFNSLLDEISSITRYWSFGDPGGIGFNTKGVKVQYKNGEMEVITFNYRGLYIYNNELEKFEYRNTTDGGGYFDEDEFNDLIEKYLETQNK